MLEQSFWQFFGACIVAGCLWLIISIAIGNLVGRFIREGMGDDDDDRG